MYRDRDLSLSLFLSNANFPNLLICSWLLGMVITAQDYD